MGGFSLIHWIILAVLLLLLFGGNRFSTMMGDVAKGLKSFKHGLSEEDEAKRNRQPPPPPQQTIDIAGTPVPPPTSASPAADPVPPAASPDDTQR